MKKINKNLKNGNNEYDIGFLKMQQVFGSGYFFLMIMRKENHSLKTKNKKNK